MTTSNGTPHSSSSPKSLSEIIGFHVPDPDVPSNNTLSPHFIPRPLSRLYTLFTLIIFLLFVLPPTFLFSFLSFYLFGPNFPTWSLRTQVLNQVLKEFLRTQSFFGVVWDHQEDELPSSWIRKGMNGTKVTIPRVSEGLRIGWAACPAVAARDVPGFMVEPKGDESTGTGTEMGRGKAAKGARNGEKIVLYFVGGGFIMGHPMRLGTAWMVAKILDSRVFSVNYRKSLTDDSAFPACLLDALSGWQYLRNELGFEARNIVLMGDSAGGNLCLALSRYLEDLRLSGMAEARNLGRPGGMILFSPWVDMTSSGESIETNENSDYPSPLGSGTVQKHIRHFPTSVRSPYFSPSLPSPHGGPRFAHLLGDGRINDTKVYVQVGTAEILYSEDLDLVGGMKKEGVDVRLREIEGDIHVGFIFKRKDAYEATKKDLPEFWSTI